MTHASILYKVEVFFLQRPLTSARHNDNVEGLGFRVAGLGFGVTIGCTCPVCVMTSFYPERFPAEMFKPIVPLS